MSLVCGHPCGCKSCRTGADYDDLLRFCCLRQHSVCSVAGLRIIHTAYTPVTRHQIFRIVEFHASLRAADAGDDVFHGTADSLVRECRISDGLTAKGYGVTVTAADRCFNCPRIMEQTDGNNRNINSFLDSLRACEVPSGRPCGRRDDCFPSLIGTCGNMQRIISVFFKHSRINDRLFHFQTADTVFLGGKSGCYGKVFTAGFLDSFADKLHEVSTAFNAAAEFIDTLVGTRGKELTAHVAVGCVDLDTVESCFLHSDSSVHIVLNQIINFLCSKFMRCFTVGGARYSRRSHYFSSQRRNCLAAGVMKLNNCLGAMFVNDGSEFCHSRDAFVCPACRLAGHTDTRRFYSCDFNNDQSETTCSTSSVVVESRLIDKTFLVKNTGIHCRYDQTVLNVNAADTVGSKCFCKAHNRVLLSLISA